MMLLVVVFLCLVYYSVQESLVGKTYEEIDSKNGIEQKQLFASFPIDIENLTALDEILKVKVEGPNFIQRAFSFPEPPERSSLFMSFAIHPELHSTVFHYSKLRVNPMWYDLFFSPKRIVEYQACLFADWEPVVNISAIRQQMSESIILSQLNRMPSLAWLQDGSFWKQPTETFALEMFDHLDMTNMTADMLALLVSVGSGEAVLDKYLSHLKTLESKDKELYIALLWCARDGNEGFAKFEDTLKDLQDAHDPRLFRREDVLEVLEFMCEGRTDKAFWDTYVLLTLKELKENTNNGKSHAVWILKNIPEDVLYHERMINFIVKAWGLYSGSQERLLAKIPEIPKGPDPSWLPSVEGDLFRWFKSIFMAVRRPFFYDHSSLFRFYTNLHNSSTRSEPWRISSSYLYVDYTKPEKISFLSKLMDMSMEVMSVKEYDLNIQNLTIIMTAWPCMILEGKKGDFSRLFPQKPTPEKWDDVTKSLAREKKGNRLSGDISQLLKRLQIFDHFTPKRLRELIDSSYDPVEDQ